MHHLVNTFSRLEIRLYYQHLKIRLENQHCIAKHLPILRLDWVPLLIRKREPHFVLHEGSKGEISSPWFFMLSHPAGYYGYSGLLYSRDFGWHIIMTTIITAASNINIIFINTIIAIITINVILLLSVLLLGTYHEYLIL